MNTTQLIPDNIPYGLFVYHLEDPLDDRSLRMVYANPAVQRLVGCPPQDLVGKTLDENFPGLRQKNVPQRFAEVVRSQSATQFEDITYGDDRLPLATFSVTAFPLPGDQLCVAFENVTERKAAQADLALVARRAQGLLALPQWAETMSETDFMQRAQELAEELTGSQIAFIHFVSDDQETIELVTWSRATLAHYCTAAADSHYPVSQAGIWADALRQRKPVVFNDYAHAQGKHGLPEGHAHLERLITVPVIEGGQVRMMTGVGNKPVPYTSMDVETVQLIGETIWRIVSKQRSNLHAKQKIRELQEWYEVTMGREERVLELKQEVDALRRRLGEPARYAVELAQELADAAGAGRAG